jgi:hypothetical protein
MERMEMTRRDWVIAKPFYEVLARLREESRGTGLASADSASENVSRALDELRIHLAKRLQQGVNRCINIADSPMHRAEMVIQGNRPVTTAAYGEVVSPNLGERNPGVQATAGTLNLVLVTIEGFESASDRNPDPEHGIHRFLARTT